MGGERRRFRADAFHHLAVRAEGIDVVVEQLEVGPVVVGGQPFLRNGHSDAHGDALAERAGGGLDAGGHAVFGVTGGVGSRLAEALDVVHRDGEVIHLLTVVIDRFHLAQMQHRIEQHRSMACRQNKAITVRPKRVFRIVAQALGPQVVGGGCHSHRGAGMARVRLLDRIDRERADRVDAQLIDIAHGFPSRLPAGTSASSPC